MSIKTRVKRLAATKDKPATAVPSPCCGYSPGPTGAGPHLEPADIDPEAQGRHLSH